MYKATARSLRRATQIHAIDVSPIAGRSSQEDVIASAQNMGKRECEEERRQLTTELARAQNELAVQQAEGNRLQAVIIGKRICSLNARLSLVKRRWAQVHQEHSHIALKDAIIEILPPDVLRKVYARADEIIEQLGRPA